MRTATDRTDAEVAALLAQEVFPRFTSRIDDIEIVTTEVYDSKRPAYRMEHEFSAISEQDVFYQMKEILVELAKKGPIAIVEPPELDEFLMGGSRAVARFGKVSFAFTSYYDWRAGKHKLEIGSWFRPVSIMYVGVNSRHDYPHKG